MKLFWRTPFVLVLGLAAMAASARAEQATRDTSLEGEVEHYLENNAGAEGEPSTFRVFWKDGLNMQSGDGNFKVKFGGRLMFDMQFVDSDSGLDPAIGENAVGFRRARFYFSGSVYKNTVFKVQIDFAGGEVEFKDVYVGLKSIGPGTLLFGQMKEPFSLNELTSSKYIGFMERAASSQAFAPSRNSGIAWFGELGEAKRIYLASGTFFSSDAQGRASGQGGWGFVVRLGGLAIENKDKDMILWLAVDFAYQDLRMSNRGSQEVRYRARPDSFGDRFINTGDIGAESDIRYAVEAAFRLKRIHAQAEFFWATPKVITGNDPTFSGFYAQVGYFITGESRPFKVGEGAWGRVKPSANFWTGDGGRGALEVLIRWDTTDLTDEAIEGGEMDTLTVGFNWYWNPNTRMMINYINADVSGSNEEGIGTGKLNIVTIRWQIDF